MKIIEGQIAIRSIRKSEQAFVLKMGIDAIEDEDGDKVAVYLHEYGRADEISAELDNMHCFDKGAMIQWLEMCLFNLKRT